MGVWEYVAAHPTSGKRSKGSLQADSARQARTQLRGQGLLPIEVKAIREEPRPGRKKRWVIPQRRLSGGKRALITRQLGALIGSNVPVDEALKLVADQIECQKSRRLLSGVRERVTEGQSLASAMSDCGAAFPEAYRQTVAAGEKAGELAAVLVRIADYEDARQQIQRKATLALIYPVILTVVALGITVGLLTYVVPQVAGVFDRSGQPLPWITQSVIAFSTLLREFGWLLALVILSAIGAGGMALRQPGVRVAVDQALLSVPVIGRLIRAADTVHFTRTLALLTKSGVSLVDAITAARKGLGNQAINEGIARATLAIQSGVAFSVALQQSGYFRPMVIHLIRNAEATGQMQEMLTQISEHEEKDLQQRIAIFMGLLEPLLILLMGALVLAIVLAIMLPLLELNQMLA